MTWPTNSKASTQNVDQSKDRIVDARPDILQNIQNTNEIIDKFVISSPANNDLLIANASNRLVNKAESSVNPYFAYVIYQTGGAGTENLADSSSALYLYLRPTGQKFDPDDILQISGFDSANDSTVINSVFIRQPGTYSFQVHELLYTDQPEEDSSFLIEVLLADGTRFEQRYTQRGASDFPDRLGADLPNVSPAEPATGFRGPVGVYNLTITDECVVRLAMSNEGTTSRDTDSNFILKIIKRG
jgi:hypothetical protein